MPTKNIECQLAQGQIGRYLNGERFSAQAIQQLEAHVADCDECSELVTRRRQALMTMLGEGANRAAVMASSTPVSSEPATPSTSVSKAPESSVERSSIEKLIAAMGREEGSPVVNPAPTAPAPTASTPQLSKIKLITGAFSSKSVLYCGALAAVLLGMSYFSKSALKTFGPTADSASVGSAGITSQPVRPAAAIKAAPVAASTSAVVNPAPTAKAPVPTAKNPGVTPVPKAIHPPVAATAVDPIADDASQDDFPEIQPVKQPVHLKTVHPRIRTHRKPVLAARHPAQHQVRRVHRATRRNDDDETPVRHARPRWHRRAATSISTPQSNIKIYDPQGRSMN